MFKSLFTYTSIWRICCECLLYHKLMSLERWDCVLVPTILFVVFESFLQIHLLYFKIFKKRNYWIIILYFVIFVCSKNTSHLYVFSHFMILLSILKPIFSQLRSAVNILHSDVVDLSKREDISFKCDVLNWFNLYCI